MYNHVSDFPNIYSTFRCCKIYIPIEEEQYDQTSDIVLTDVSLSLECQEDEDAYNAGDQVVHLKEKLLFSFGEKRQSEKRN